MPTSSACRSTASTTPATCSSAPARRETAARVAAGTLAKLLLAELGTEVLSHVIQMGSVRGVAWSAGPLPPISPAVDDSPVRCFDPAAEALMVAAVEAAAKDGDSLGGVVEVLGYGVPQGLGSHVHWDRKIDGLLAQALMSIQAMKGVEIGDGFEVAGLRGSQAHDEILWDDESGDYLRGGTRAGGTEGGMTTGGLLVVRVGDEAARHAEPPGAPHGRTWRPRKRRCRSRSAPTSPRSRRRVSSPRRWWRWCSRRKSPRKFGGDSVAELVRNHAAYVASLH